MKKKEIYYRCGFFRLLNGKWTPQQFEEFFVLEKTLQKDEKPEFYVMGGDGMYNPPLALAGPFREKEEAQAALDSFFLLGGFNA
jgi:hypothetical protein